MSTPAGKISDMLAGNLDDFKNEIFTGLPAKIIAYNASTQTCTAQPLMQSGEIAMPVVYNVPVIFPAGGGAVMSFPVTAGDRCWLAFSMYPIDEFINSDGKSNSNINYARIHDYSECVAYVGLGTMKQNYAPDPDNVMVRFGSTVWTMDSVGNMAITANVKITGTLEVTETATVTKEITGKDFISSDTGVTFNNHVHHYFWTDPGGESDTETPE